MVGMSETPCRILEGMVVMMVTMLFVRREEVR